MVDLQEYSTSLQLRYNFLELSHGEGSAMHDSAQPAWFMQGL